MAFANGGLEIAFSLAQLTVPEAGTYSKWALKRDEILPHALNSFVWNGSPSVFQDRSNIDGFPFDGSL
jgi:hypothetical protein